MGLIGIFNLFLARSDIKLKQSNPVSFWPGLSKMIKPRTILYSLRPWMTMSSPEDHEFCWKTFQQFQSTRSSGALYGFVFQRRRISMPGRKLHLWHGDLQIRLLYKSKGQNKLKHYTWSEWRERFMVSFSWLSLKISSFLAWNEPGFFSSLLQWQDIRFFYHHFE